MTEVVRPADGAPVALSPCPAWCTEGPALRRLAQDVAIEKVLAALAGDWGRAGQPARDS